MDDFMRDGGFLSPKSTSLIAQNRAANAPFFKLAEQINRSASGLADKIGEPQTRQIAFVTMLRGVEIYQSIIILAERGIVNGMATSYSHVAGG
jgi:hypothetical protein